jgi:hypothetical protein
MTNSSRAWVLVALATMVFLAIGHVVAPFAEANASSVLFAFALRAGLKWGLDDQPANLGLWVKTHTALAVSIGVVTIGFLAMGYFGHGVKVPRLLFHGALAVVFFFAFYAIGPGRKR